jgi:hypothetical protein
LLAIADALEALANGKTVAFSWRTLITGRAAEPSELRRFVDIQPVLHFGECVLPIHSGPLDMAPRTSDVGQNRHPMEGYLADHCVSPHLHLYLYLCEAAE